MPPYDKPTNDVVEGSSRHDDDRYTSNESNSGDSQKQTSSTRTTRSEVSNLFPPAPPSIRRLVNWNQNNPNTKTNTNTNMTLSQNVTMNKAISPIEPSSSCPPSPVLESSSSVSSSSSSLDLSLLALEKAESEFPKEIPHHATTAESTQSVSITNNNSCDASPRRRQDFGKDHQLLESQYSSPARHSPSIIWEPPILESQVTRAVQRLPFQFEASIDSVDISNDTIAKESIGSFWIRRPHDGSDTFSSFGSSLLQHPQPLLSPLSSLRQIHRQNACGENFGIQSFEEYTSQANVMDPSSLEVGIVLPDGSTFVLYDECSVQYQSIRNDFGGGGNVQYFTDVANDMNTPLGFVTMERNIDVSTSPEMTPDTMMTTTTTTSISLDEVLEQAILVRQQYCHIVMRMAQNSLVNNPSRVRIMPIFFKLSALELVQLSYAPSLDECTFHQQQNHHHQCKHFNVNATGVAMTSSTISGTLSIKGKLLSLLQWFLSLGILLSLLLHHSSSYSSSAKMNTATESNAQPSLHSNIEVPSFSSNATQLLGSSTPICMESKQADIASRHCPYNNVDTATYRRQTPEAL